MLAAFITLICSNQTSFTTGLAHDFSSGRAPVSETRQTSPERQDKCSTAPRASVDRLVSPEAISRRIVCRVTPGDKGGISLLIGDLNAHFTGKVKSAGAKCFYTPLGRGDVFLYVGRMTVLLKMETWVTRFAARRWKLSSDSHADTHLERGRLLYDAMQHLDPQEVAEQDYSSIAFPAAPSHAQVHSLEMTEALATLIPLPARSLAAFGKR